MRQLLGLALAPLLLVVACTGDTPDDDGPRATEGDVLAVALPGSVEGRHTFVVVPGARYDFTTTLPRERLDATSAADAGVSPEGDGAVRFVTVVWSLDVAPGDTFVMRPPAEVSPLLTLVADGERHEVGALDEEGRHAATVVVPEGVDDVGLEIEYDGLTQVIEDAYDQVVTRADGPGRLYHDAPVSSYRSCATGRLRGGDPRVSFFGGTTGGHVSTPLPYVGPLGWAAPGRAWVVADLVTDPVSTASWDGSDYVGYDVSAAVSLRLDGQEPVRLLPREEGDDVGPQEDGSWAAVAVFDVEDVAGDGPLELRRVLTATPEDEAEARSAGAPSGLRRVQTCRL